MSRKITIITAILMTMLVTTGACASVEEAPPEVEKPYTGYVAQIDETVKGDVWRGFGASACWWGQWLAGENAALAADKLFDAEKGPGLEVYRYNIGAGEAENPNKLCTIPTRAAESFYYYNETTCRYEYDFTRDSVAWANLQLALQRGVKEVILFCNSPHYSMTVRGSAIGGEGGASNLPRENYAAFVDYLLTIADYFVAQGVPVSYISPINEPQWDWGAGTYQEGCHYTATETVELLEAFALEMQRRGVSYGLTGTESGEMSAAQRDYVIEYFDNETLNAYCETFSGHSYWLDHNRVVKRKRGNFFRTTYPEKAFIMTEWCELPQKLDVNSIESALYMANVIEEDINLLGAVGWHAWAAVNGDGLLDVVDGELKTYMRYYAMCHFARFMKSGDNLLTVTLPEELETVRGVAATDGKKVTVVLINNGETATELKLNTTGSYATISRYLTDAQNNFCPLPQTDTIVSLPPQSLTTIVLE